MTDEPGRNEPATGLAKLFRMLIWVIIIPLGLLATLMIYLYLNQGKMVFAPTTEILLTPKEIGLSYQEIFVKVSDEVTIHSWYFKPDTAHSGKTILFCHGNAGNISTRLETVQFLLEQGASVFLFDYRGYGKSSGTPSEAGLYADAESCYQYLIEELGLAPEDIIIFGRSLGGAVAIELATRVSAGGLVVESTFTSVADMAKTFYPYLPVRMLVRYPFASLEKVGALTLPLLVAHSPDDDLIPFQMGRRIYERAKGPKLFYQLRGSHNELAYLHDEAYIAVIQDMLQGRIGLNN